MIALSGRSDERSRRTNALIVPVPVTGPAQSARLSSSVSRSMIASTSPLVGGHEGAVERHRATAVSGSTVASGRGVHSQPRGDLVDHDRVLVALIFGVGEHVRQQLLIAELRQRPPERL